MRTPVLSHHARQRCAEMGVSTKRIKRIMQAATGTLDWPSRDDRSRTWDGDPTICVVYNPETNVIITVTPRTFERYERTSS